MWLDVFSSPLQTSFETTNNLKSMTGEMFFGTFFIFVLIHSDLNEIGNNHMILLCRFCTILLTKIPSTF